MPEMKEIDFNKDPAYYNIFSAIGTQIDDEHRKKILRILLYRMLTGAGLKEAKDIIESNF